MKFYRVLTLAVVTALSVSFFSCSDDDDDDNFDTTYLPKTIVEKEFYDGGTSSYAYNFSYDSDNRLIEWTEGSILYTITYGADGKITKLEETYSGNTEGIITNFKYEGNKISFLNEDNEVDEVITINNNGTIASFTEDDHTDKFSYSGKNITSINSTYEDEGYTGTGKLNIKYDGKAGVFRNVNTPQWFIYTHIYSEFGMTTGNNAATLDERAYIEGVEVYKGAVKNTFEYNEEKYPKFITSISTWEYLIDIDGVAPKVAKRNKKATRSIADSSNEPRTSKTEYTVTYGVK